MSTPTDRLALLAVPRVTTTRATMGHYAAAVAREARRHARPECRICGGGGLRSECAPWCSPEVVW